MTNPSPDGLHEIVSDVEMSMRLDGDSRPTKVFMIPTSVLEKQMIRQRRCSVARVRVVKRTIHRQDTARCPAQQGSRQHRREDERPRISVSRTR